MAQQHLVLAYIVTWVLQLGYVAWIGLKWAKVKRAEKRGIPWPQFEK